MYVITCLIALSLVTIVLDLFFSATQNTSFYLAESLLFSTFWLLFLPLFTFQLKLIGRSKKTGNYILITSVVTVLHLLIYPIMVWILSMAFYNHTFSYGQTFNFGLNEYFIKCLIIYSFATVVIGIYKQKIIEPAIMLKEDNSVKQPFITTLIVSNADNKKTVIETNDILYFSANSPYINIHHLSKKYLHKQTIRYLEAQLNDKEFIRIHKSSIVNVNKVKSYQSRLNGDYDVTLSDDTRLRLSRNYVPAFRSAMEGRHRLTVK